jgi:hypothetical protein
MDVRAAVQMDFTIIKKMVINLANMALPAFPGDLTSALEPRV